MDNPRSRRTVAGLTLIGLGVALFALQRFEGIGHAAIFFLIGGSFLAAYLFRREYGLLVPACILLGLGVGSTLEFPGNSTQLGLGCGFVAIYLIALAYQRKSHPWPLIPGGVLILLSLDERARIYEYLTRNWPLILVLLGVLILLGGVGRSRSGRESGGPTD